VDAQRSTGSSEVNIPINLSARKLTRILMAGFLFLLAMHLFLVFAHFVLQVPVRALTFLFDLDTEANVPSFFNSLLFFLIAVLFFLVGRASNKWRLQWLLLSAIFIFLTVDEGSQIHERFILPTLRFLDTGKQSAGWLYYAWVIPYGTALLLLGVFYWRFIMDLPARTRIGLFVGGIVYLAGAVFFELWSGREAWQVHDMGLEQNLTYVLRYTVEECMEMIGLMIFIHTLMLHLGRAGTRVEVRILDPSERRAVE
jgi:hypothetical protein